MLMDTQMLSFIPHRLHRCFWLQDNANCPICRTSVTFNFDQILDTVCLSYSSQNPYNFMDGDEDQET